MGLIGAALLYGDGVITPAISVLSAVEGLKLDAPQDTVKGFAVLPKPWIVERTFGWLNRCRRLAKDVEKTASAPTSPSSRSP